MDEPILSLVFIFLFFQAKTKLYFTTLSEIHEKITPLLRHRFDEKDETSEKVKEVESKHQSLVSDIKMKTESESSKGIDKKEIKEENQSVTGKDRETNTEESSTNKKTDAKKNCEGGEMKKASAGESNESDQ